MQVNVPRNIKEFQEKSFGGLTFRQLVSLVLVLGFNIYMFYTYRIVKGYDPETIKRISMFVSIAILLIGFKRFYGMTAEKFVVVFITNNFIKNEKRHYTGRGLK